MFVLSPTTVWNPSALETRSSPKRVFGRIALLPRRGARVGLWLRVLVESQPLRFISALLPFVVAMFVWPHLALPIAQAPLAMVIVIGFVELKVFRISEDDRKKIISEEDADRVLDTLRFRAQAALRKISADRDLRNEEIILVIEQSELARITPLTLVSVQTGMPTPEVLALEPDEIAMLSTSLFDADMTEHDLLRANLRDGEPLRSYAFDARGVSAHARLAARMRKPKTMTAEAL